MFFKSIFVFFVFIAAVNFGFGADFTEQKDSYFGYHKTKIFWTIGNGIKGGFSHGLVNGLSASTKGFETRIKGYTKPANKYIQYIYTTINIDYNYYNNEQDKVKNEIFYTYSVFGLGIELFNNFTVYAGGGAGAVFEIDRYNVTAVNSDDIVWKYNMGMTYVVNLGVEYYLSKMISLYIDEKYFYNSIDDNSKFIPDKLFSYSSADQGEKIIDDGDSFEKKSINFSELSFSIGVRFYWGQDMFWFGSFWEKN